jgi:hypothetical protein
VFKRNYFSLLIFLLMASVTLTACDSNEAEDTVAVVEEPNVTETVVTVAPDAPVVQEVVAAVASDPGLASAVADVAGAGVIVVVSTDPGAIVQTTSTVDPVSAGQPAPPPVTTTIAPLVNQATGQPIAAAAVVSTVAGVTQTVIATANTSNPAAIQMSAAQSTGTTSSSSTTQLNAGFDPSALNTTATSAAARAFVARRTTLLQGGQSFAWRTRADGSTWATSIQSALATGKRRNLIIILAGYQDAIYITWGTGFSAARQQCLASSSVQEVRLSFSIALNIVENVTLNCADLRATDISMYPPAS